MGSKGRLPPHHLRHPLSGPGIGHRDSYPPEIRPQHGAFPPYDMLPRPEVMEQKIGAQHVEMQKLATENQRFAATHVTLRQDLAAIQHELRMLHNHIGGVKSEREHQIMGLLDKLGKMEADLHGAEPLKLELQKARAEAQSLLSARDELVLKVQQLTEDHQRAHVDLQQIPALISELESLRHEYQQCRSTYEYEKKLYNDHLESLQVMEKNYMSMASEVEKLRAELKKYGEADRRAVGPYAGFAGYNDKDASGHYPVGQNAYDDTYGVPQGRVPLPGGGGAGAGAGAAAAAADGNHQVGAQSGATGVRGGYDAYRGSGPAGPVYDVHRGVPGSGYDVQKGAGGPAYDPQRGAGGSTYDTQRGSSGPPYDPHRGPAAPGYDAYRGAGGTGYDPQRGVGGPGYDMHRGSLYETQRGSGYDIQRGAQYEAHRGTNFESPKGVVSGAQGQAVMQQANNVTYGSGGSGFLGAPQQQQPPTAAMGDGNHPGRR